MPGSFLGDLPTTEPTTGPTTHPTTRPRPIDLARWWESFDDAELNSLVRRSIESNLDLRIAIARLQETRELEWATVGGYVPGLGSIGASFTATGARGSGTNSTAGREPGSINSAINASGLKQVTHDIGIDATWELDLFGRMGRLAEAVQADTQAAVEARNDVLLTLIADVAHNYVEVRTLQLRLEIAQEYVDTERRTVKLVRLRRERLIGNQLDVALAERQLSAALSRVAPLQSAIAAAQRRVAVLLGEFPEALRGELDRPGPLPALPPGVAPGLPAALLRRRPDIRNAERQLAAITARAGVATADLFPRVVFVSGAGFEGQGLGITPVINKNIYSIGPALYWPFLDFGRLEALVLALDFQGQQSFYTYRRTVINAVREVDDALTGYSAAQDQLRQLSDAVASSNEAVQLATERFQNGLTDFLNVLDAQRSLDDLQDQFAWRNSRKWTSSSCCTKLLGGGWEGYETPRPANAATSVHRRGGEVAQPGAADAGESGTFPLITGVDRTVFSDTGETPVIRSGNNADPLIGTHLRKRPISVMPLAASQHSSVAALRSRKRLSMGTSALRPPSRQIHNHRAIP